MSSPNLAPIDRRAFLGGLVGSALAAPLAAKAQPSGKVWRIGLLSAGSQPAAPGLLAELLRELGYAPGQNLAIEARYADGKAERLPELAADLVRLNARTVPERRQRRPPSARVRPGESALRRPGHAQVTPWSHPGRAQVRSALASDRVRSSLLSGISD